MLACSSATIYDVIVNKSNSVFLSVVDDSIPIDSERDVFYVDCMNVASISNPLSIRIPFRLFCSLKTLLEMKKTIYVGKKSYVRECRYPTYNVYAEIVFYKLSLMKLGNVSYMVMNEKYLHLFGAYPYIIGTNLTSLGAYNHA